MTSNHELKIIEQIYEAAATPETGWIELIRSFNRAFPEAKTVLATYDEGSICVSRTASDIDVSVLNDYATHFAHINPIVPPLMVADPATYFDADDLIDRETFHRTEVWNDFWRPLGNLERNVGVVLENGNGLFSTFCTHYPDLDEDRERHETPGHLIRLMLPHLQRALRIQERVERAACAAKSLLDMMDDKGQAAFLVNATGKVREQNRTAERLLRQRDPLRSGPNGRLSLTDNAFNEQLQAALKSAFSLEQIAEEKTAGIAIPTTDRDGNYFRVTVGPGVSTIQSRKNFAHLREKFSLITIEQLGTTRRPDPSLLRHAFKLTPAENRLSLALFEGHSLAEIAEMNGLSKQTVRNQIRSVFDKTGTNRQAELVSLLSKFA